MNSRWSIIGSAAVVALGIGLALQAAPTSPGQTSGTQATTSEGQVLVGNKPVIKAGPGIPQELRVMPPLSVDYRRDATNYQRRGAMVIVGDREIGKFKTREGGIASSALACVDTEECADCNFCTNDECNSLVCANPFVANGVPALGCDDGLFCNGTETCDGAGNCLADATPPEDDCAALSQLCREGDGTHICYTPCTVNTDCDDGLDCTSDSCDGGSGVCSFSNACGPDAVCTEGGPTCGTGRCCVGTTCSQVTEADCGGAWLSTPTACGELETGNFDICPNYGGGIAPQGLFTNVIGPISPLAATGHSLCADDFTSIGDDYITSDAGATDYMDVMLLRFAGDVLPESAARWAIAFYDTSTDPPTFIEDVFWPDGTNDADEIESTIKTVDFDPPLRVPTTGMIVWTVQENFGPNGRVNLLTTDAADVGTNDADKMWVNGAVIDDGDVVAGIPPAGERVIAFELVGTPAAAPIAACCVADTGVCEEKLPWICDAEGNVPQDEGVKCASCSNDLFKSCTVNTDCKACEGGNLDGAGCLVDADCDDQQGNPGTCTGQATCNPILPACLVSACCAGTGECADVSGGSCTGTVCSLDPFTTGCTDDTDCTGDLNTCVDVSGRDFQGFGTDCDPNCCLQPTPTGGDTCLEVTLHKIKVPGQGEPPVRVTITGNNSAATFKDFTDGICDQFPPEGLGPPWWEGFSIDDCAEVRLDLCCTDISGEPLRPAFGGMTKDCNPCGVTVGSAGVEPPIGQGVGTRGFARGGPFCDDDNLWSTYGPLREGEYYYPIYSKPDGTSAVPPGADYQMHFTVGACLDAACCLPSATCVGGPNNGTGCGINDDCVLNPGEEICVDDSNRPNELCCPDGACNNDPQNPVCVGGSRNTLPCCDGGGDCKGNCVTDCTLANQLECNDLEGYWHGPGNVPIGESPTLSCDFGVCDRGSCCFGPGDCVDFNNPNCDPDAENDPNCCQPLGTNCMTAKDCRDTNGTYVGGAECDFLALPCPVCEIQTSTNCQLSDLTQTFQVMMSDLHHAGNGVTTADDFVALTDQDITQVCTWGVYMDGSDCGGGGEGPGCDCADAVSDDFRVTVFNDAGGFPGTILGQSSVSAANTTRAPARSNWDVNNPDGQLYAYQLFLDTPITGLTAENTYWIEVANNTPQDDDCTWNWAQSSNEFNTFSAVGSNLGYTAGAGRTVDMPFCVNVPIDTPPAPEAACCACAADGGTCSGPVDLPTCGANARWDATEQDCIGVTCPATIPGDVCETDIIPITGDVSLSFDSSCTDTDGPSEGTLNFGGDIWYAYTVQCTGAVTVSMCGTGQTDNSYDSAVGVYFDSNDRTHCPCDSDPGFSRIGATSAMDEGCTGISDGGSGWLRPGNFAPGDCLTVRVGGFDGGRGRGSLVVGCETAICPPSSPPTVQTQFDPVANAGAPEPKNRFIPIRAGDAGRDQSVRVIWTAMPNWPGGSSSLAGQTKYLLEPTQVCENSGDGLAKSPPACSSAPGQPQKWFWMARLGCNPTSAWFGDLAGLTDYCSGSGEACTPGGDPCIQGTCGVDGVIHIVDEGIVPSKLAAGGGSISQPAEFTVQVVDSECFLDQEGSFSEPLSYIAAGHGDIVGGAPGCPMPPPNFQASLVPDVTGALDKFANSVCAAKKTRADVEPGFQDLLVNISDVLRILNAFSGTPYGFAAPAACPAAAAKIAQSPRVRE
jgi:hypothetical protein